MHVDGLLSSKWIHLQEQDPVKVKQPLSVSASKKVAMKFGHEKLDVYRSAIEYFGWIYRFKESLKGHLNMKDQACSHITSDPTEHS